MTLVRDYFHFLYRCFRLSFVGDWRYHLWMFALTVISLIGLNAYAKQFVQGLVTTGMTDQVSWGLYIANFTYLVGVAAAAVMLVIPVYIYKNKDLHNLVIFGELLAVVAIVMCLMFIMVDLGRPDRFHHMLLRFNFPISILTWDVIALNGYLLLNLHICGYLIWCAYNGRKPTKKFYIPFVFIAIAWAISIHTVTAFLYSGLGARPFWNSAVIAPRFLASAFAAGPALIILTLQVIKSFTGYPVADKAISTLKGIITVALGINMFLLVSELFTEFYTGSSHSVSAKYLFFGLHGYHGLVPWIWTAIVFNTVALVFLLNPASKQRRILNLSCVLLIIGIWIEKGMGLIVPAFIPSPIGEIVEYRPTLNEVLVCLGIWAFGFLVYTILVRVTIPVLYGELRIDKVHTTEIKSDQELKSSVVNANISQ
jgi:Ni/Fe-hydrogenase subunit HybB-like protein